VVLRIGEQTFEDDAEAAEYSVAVCDVKERSGRRHELVQLRPGLRINLGTFAGDVSL